MCRVCARARVCVWSRCGWICVPSLHEQVSVWVSGVAWYHREYPVRLGLGAMRIGMGWDG